jgi:hypothetical protein
VKVGDLVIADESVKDDRNIGTVLAIDSYCGPSRFSRAELIVEIFWNTGTKGWILMSRVNLIDESWRASSVV